MPIFPESSLDSSIFHRLVFYSPSSQGKPPDKNCSGVSPPLGVTNFNGVASADVGLSAGRAGFVTVLLLHCFFSV